MKSLLLVFIGFAVFAFTFYSIEGLSAFGLGVAGSEPWDGRPDFPGRDYVPAAGGMLGGFVTLKGIGLGFASLKESSNIYAKISIALGCTCCIWVALKLFRAF